MIAITLPVALPLGAAAVSMALGRWPTARRVLGVAVLAVTLAFSVVLLLRVSDGTVLAIGLGGWEAPVGISLVVDTFSAIMLSVSSAMLLAVLVFAIGSPRTDDARAFFHPVYLVLAAGVSLSFLTGDLFNLFVAFEVTLTASYVLITFGGSRLQVRHGMTYVVISLLASTFFITAIGLTYAAAGSVDMADLVSKLEAIDPDLRNALGTLFLVVFGVKAAIFPLFFWLPDAYPAAPSPVTAIFAGLLTKMGVYAIIRTQTLLFGTKAGPSGLLLTVAGLTMVVGILGAIAQDDVKRILSFNIISGVGFMIFGLGLFSVTGLAATVFYLAHHIVVMTSLFLVDGLIETRTGTAALRRLGGLLRASSPLAALFLLPALSLAGVPPLSGFIGKVALVQAGLESGAVITVAVSLVVSLLTLFSMTKIWAGAFWGSPMDPPPIPAGLERGAVRSSALTMGATAALVLASLAFVVAADPLYDLGQAAAAGLVDSAAYVGAVMEP